MIKRTINSFLFVHLLFLLLGCQKEEEPDISPNAFFFEEIQNARLSTFYTSDTVTITGISHPTHAWFNYTPPAEVYVNGQRHTSNPLAVKQGDQIYIKVLSSEYYATTTEASITIGDQSAEFKVTTQPFPLQAKGYPGTSINNVKSFIIDDRIYMGLGNDYQGGLKEFYEFNISENSWTKKTDFTGNTDFSYYFSSGGKGYAGYENSILEYDPATDSWKSIENVSLGENVSSQSIFQVNDEVYALVDYTSSASGAWQFDADHTSWILVTEIDNTVENKHFLFSLEGKAFFRTTDTEDLLEYDISSHTWTTKKALPMPGSKFGFNLKGKGYICYSSPEGKYIYEYEPQINNFREIQGINEQSPPDELNGGLSTGQQAFIITASYSGVLGAASLAEFLIY